jgi:hypothetical protein
MSIVYHSFRLGELYEAVGSNDLQLLAKLDVQLLERDPELLTAAKAILIDGLLYHEAFTDDLYNDALIHIVRLLPSYRSFSEDLDYHIDYHDAWRHLPRRSLLRRYWGYLTHGRYLFDHPIHPSTRLRYGFLTREELPEFLHLVEKEGEKLPWYFFQGNVDAVRLTTEVGDDLFVSIHIKGRRYRVIRVRDTQD